MGTVHLIPRDPRFDAQVKELRTSFLSGIRMLNIAYDVDYDWRPRIMVCSFPDMGDDQAHCLGKIITHEVHRWAAPVFFLPRGFQTRMVDGKNTVVAVAQPTTSAKKMMHFLRVTVSKHAGSCRMHEPVITLCTLLGNMPRDTDELMLMGKPATQCRGWDIDVRVGDRSVYSLDGDDAAIGEDRKGA